ncbi:SHOCT domain-containing protein [Kutzneria buriramensis]|uniref:Putative oligomerization/nucleic acid binding protein n=1 Tax=Kutzneria buriramensis TaxID=1045776 RepID=A0A3E0H0I7_9PSEU|nr:SHOCT domain-containing protein [Kutzneria buriramensis]REH34882.1 putative oligomerization/nucleic acid binding protein [Kutzneria buriramensis]
MNLAQSSGYPMLDVLWTMLIVFAWIIWFWLLITVFADLFRRHDISGWGKAGWTVLVILLPFVGVLAYLIAEGSAMAVRREVAAQETGMWHNHSARPVSAADGPAEQIAKAKHLLDSGAITRAEYETLKHKALMS